MPITMTLQNTMNWAGPLLINQPQMLGNYEPGLTAGNIVLETMLGPPMKWPWNRKNFSIALSTVGGTDYVVALADWGFFEKGSLVDANGKTYPVQGQVSLAKESSQNRPSIIAPQYDDDAGNITFRFDFVPDGNYTFNGEYQKAPTLITAPAAPWGVVPDRFGFIYNWGYLAIISTLVKDSRFPIFEKYFVSRLLGAQDGLTDQERNIFIGNWTALISSLGRTQSNLNAGAAGRAN